MGINLQERIDRLQRIIILHSYIYYELDDNAITDREYDLKSKELVKYKNDYPELWRNSEYYKQFGDDYNGATGFSLYRDLDEHQKAIIRYIAIFRHSI